eukprot:9502723-Heterocapsa_arctica.AAC.1
MRQVGFSAEGWLGAEERWKCSEHGHEVLGEEWAEGNPGPCQEVRAIALELSNSAVLDHPRLDVHGDG